MTITKKLYDMDAYATRFEATVLSCSRDKKGYSVVLDQTLFFPEEGGQKADGGTLNDMPVLDVQLNGDEIVHLLAEPLIPGSTICGKIDWAERFRKMQNHTGEHIISGIIHRRYGLENVGFHLGDEEVTLDVSGELTRAQLDEIELEANEVIYRCLPVVCEYPSREQLPSIVYRSKRAIEGNIRLVRIGDVDVCACCAPHVRNTGEIGIIKLLDFIRYKGGVRIHMKCGSDAVRDYQIKFREISTSAALFSLKQNELHTGLQAFLQENERCRFELRAAKQSWAQAIAATLAPSDGILFYLHPERDIPLLRDVALAAAKPALAAVALGGDDTEGYAYAISATHVPLRTLAREINRALGGRGGGSDSLIQGFFAASESEIRQTLASLLAPISTK